MWFFVNRKGIVFGIVVLCCTIVACNNAEPDKYVGQNYVPSSSSDSMPERFAAVQRRDVVDSVRRRLDIPANAIVLRKGETRRDWPFLADSMYFFCADDVPFFWDLEGNVYAVNSESIDSGYAPIEEAPLVWGISAKFLVSIVEENCR